MKTMKTKMRLTGVALVGAAALLGAACGDDSASDTATTQGAASGAAASFGFKALDAGGPITKQALEKGDIQIGLLFSSDGSIVEKGWVTLEDDKQLQPADNVTPVIRTTSTNDGINKAINDVSAKITTDELAQANKKMDIDKADPAQVATDWLKSKSLDSASPALTGKITVASFNFSESEFLANVYGKALAAKGVTVSYKLKLGSREVVEPALEKGDVDLVPEYVGTLTTFLKGTATGDAKANADALAKIVNGKGITVLTPAPGQDQNAFVVTKATATKYSLKKVSDLATVKDKLVLGGPPECPTRDFCIAGLKAKYGLKFDV